MRSWHNDREWHGLSFGELISEMEYIISEFRTTFICIDTLDECDEGAKSELFRVIARLANISRLLTMSRDRPTHSDPLRKCKYLEISAQESDIEQYILSEENRLLGFSELMKDDHIKNDVTGALIRETNGMCVSLPPVFGLCVLTLS